MVRGCSSCVSSSDCIDCNDGYALVGATDTGHRRRRGVTLTCQDCPIDCLTCGTQSGCGQCTGFVWDGSTCKATQIQIVSDGSSSRPHCTRKYGLSCGWPSRDKYACAVGLCVAAGFDEGVFVSADQKPCHKMSAPVGDGYYIDFNDGQRHQGLTADWVGAQVTVSCRQVSCADIIPGGQSKWTDGSQFAHDCAEYASRSWCAAHGEDNSNFGYTPNQACCACGGGQACSTFSSSITCPSSICTWTNFAYSGGTCHQAQTRRLTGNIV